MTAPAGACDYHMHVYDARFPLAAKARRQEPDALVPALAAFNIGVEIGQVAIVALVFPLLLLADRLMAAGAVGKGRQPSLVYSCSAVIFALGLYWLIERTVWA